MVECFQCDLSAPISIGSVITVKHAGSNSKGRLRAPIFWRERKDILWQDISVSQYISSDDQLLPKVVLLLKNVYNLPEVSWGNLDQEREPQDIL